MLSRTELQKYNHANPPKKMLPRSKEVEKIYETNIIKGTLQQKFIKRIMNELVNNDYYFIENNYPYNIEESIQHYVCWIKNDCLNVERIIEQINEQYGMKVITYWENLVQNKSIHEIRHVHVFLESMPCSDGKLRS